MAHRNGGKGAISWDVEMNSGYEWLISSINGGILYRKTNGGINGF